MSLLRVLLAIFFPPLAVIDQGCGSVLIVFLLTLCGWVPGVIGALVILNRVWKYNIMLGAGGAWVWHLPFLLVCLMTI